MILFVGKIVRQQGCSIMKLAKFSSCSSVCAGSKWRLERGLGKCGNEYGPLTDIPDWSYADGRPAPLWPREVRRREQQKQLAGRAATLISELKFAKQRHANDNSTNIKSSNINNNKKKNS
jgi:large subunit ribosomal protein L52